MQPLIHEGTSASRIGTLNNDHLALLRPLLARGPGSLEVATATLSNIWNRLLEQATRVETQALSRVEFHLEHFKQFNKSSGEPDSFFFVFGPEEETLEAALWGVYLERRRARLLQLRALLRAKLLRRLVSLCRSYRHLPLTGKRSCPQCETGSAAATARRMFPLGAPPLGV